MILLVAFILTLVFLLIVGRVVPALLFSMPALAIHAGVGFTARLAPLGAAIGTAVVANLAVAVAGFAWLQSHPSRGQGFIDDAGYALAFFLVGAVAALLLIGYVRVFGRPRGRDLS